MAGILVKSNDALRYTGIADPMETGDLEGKTSAKYNCKLLLPPGE